MPNRSKIDAWRARGKRPLSIREVEDVLSTLPLMRPPAEIIILDGVIDLGEQVAVGATPVADRKLMILTPLSDQNTIAHEVIHGLGLGEFAARAMTPFLDFRRRNYMGFMRRQVSYQREGVISPEELRTRVGLVSPMLSWELDFCRHNLEAIPLEIKRYVLTG